MPFTRLMGRLRQAHPDHHAIAHNMAWIALFVLLGKFVSAAKEMAIAHRYGISAEVDVYLFVFNLLTWPVSVWFSVLTVVLVPLFVRIRQNVQVEVNRFQSELLGITLVLGLLLACLAWFGLPLFLTGTWSGLTGAMASEAVDVVRLLVLLAPLGVLASLYSVWLLAGGRQLNTLVESVPALTILIALIAFPASGLEPLIWGTLIGATLHVLVLGTLLATQGELGVPRFTLQSPHWIPFRQGFGIMLVGQTIMSLIGIIDQFFAANLGVGAIATLGYANRILALILSMGALAVTRATLPVLSNARAKEGEHANRVTVYWVRLMLALGIVTMLASWWLAPLGIRLLYEHGKFTSQDTAVVVTLLRNGLLQIPFHFSGMVMVSLLASQGRYDQIAIIGVLSLLGKIAFNAISIPLLGINALMISTSLMAILTSIMLFLVTSKNKN